MLDNSIFKKLYKAVQLIYLGSTANIRQLKIRSTGKITEEKTIAIATIIAFILVLFAAVGTLRFCGTWHDFSAAHGRLTPTTGNMLI